MTRIGWLGVSIALYLLLNSSLLPPPPPPPQSVEEDVNEHIAYSDRVLIVRDPQVLDLIGYDPSPQPAGHLSSFASFKTVLEQAGAKQFDAATAAWGLSSVPRNRLLFAWPACEGGKKCLDTAPFRLLALTFRPDLANFRCGEAEEGDNACGAEMHFEFAQIVKKAADEQSSMIVEYSISKQTKADLQDMMRSWTQLATIAAPDALAEGIKAKWTERRGQFDGVKLRFAAKRNTSWELRQYAFDAASGQLIASTTLPGEIAPEKWMKPPCTVNEAAKTFLQGFNGDVQTIPQSFLGPTATVPSPLVFEVGADFTRETRFAIGANTCSGCHSRETGTPTLHIRNREHGAKSKLSPFLTGNSSQNGEPTLGQHFVADPGKCNQDGAPPPKRGFNDLVRRRQWIQAVLAFDASQQNWTQQLREKSLSIQSIH